MPIDEASYVIMPVATTPSANAYEPTVTSASIAAAPSFEKTVVAAT